MMKYQEPEMNIIELALADVITASNGETLYPSTDTDDDGKSVGGGGSIGWGF